MLFIVPLNSSASTVALTVACPLTRFSHSQLTYSFPVSTGPKFLRLFFYSTSYQNFHRSKAYFSVKAGPYTLLQDFNASLHADAGNDPGDYLFREYCTNLKDGDRLNITFIASKTSQNPDSYAFINGIEIVSMPPFTTPILTTSTSLDCLNSLVSISAGTKYS
ncbi:hypothetical protein AAZV13_18G213300 [Glycine max]